jgi:hypothetical protein
VLRKTDIHKKSSLNLGGFIALLTTAYGIYYFFVKNTCLPSIPELLSSNNMFNHWHILAVGLIPVYLGLIIFGTAVLSLYIGSILQRWISQYWNS